MYGYMEGGLKNKPWLMGEAFTMADCAAYPPLFYLNEMKPFADKPNMSAYFKRLMERPSIAKVVAEISPLLGAMKEG